MQVLDLQTLHTLIRYELLLNLLFQNTYSEFHSLLICHPLKRNVLLSYQIYLLTDLYQ